MDQFHSPDSQITCGIPQGSILGPYLSSMFVNDLPLYISNCIYIYLLMTQTSIFVVIILILYRQLYKEI